jgi:acyl carrier protein phosphodiesterase
MNWLAHIQLSGSSTENQIGNLIPDIISGSKLTEIAEQFQPGIRLHRIIDIYTDSHPIFRRSVSRIDGSLRRYAPILVDLFYDHFLARTWSSYSLTSLEEFVGNFHKSIDTFRTELPDLVYERLKQIRDEEYLLSYNTKSGVARALTRVSSRLRRPVELAVGVEHLSAHYQAFAGDFQDFYPQLMNHATLRASTIS